MSDIAYKNPALSAKDRASDLLSRMTVEEKVDQLRCLVVMSPAGDKNNKALKHCDNLKDDAPHGLGQVLPVFCGDTDLTPVKYVNLLQKHFVESTRLGIPIMVHNEGVHGFMGANPVTNFPIPPAIGSTFNDDLVEEMYEFVGKETRRNGYTMCFAPVLDVIRDPRYGRVEELLSEDPYQTSRMGLRCVKALQGDTSDGNIDCNHVAATAKHFVAYSYPEGGLNAAPALVSERSLREVMLAPFKACVEAGIKSIMASYNEIDGVPVHGNKRILRDILKNEYGFEGVVVSDYSGIKQLKIYQSVAESYQQAAILGVEAGVDQEFPTGQCYPTLVDAVEKGLVDIKYIDDCVYRVILLKFQMGLFENPYMNENIPPLDGRELCLRMGHQGAVLLKNENILPFNKKKIKSIAVVGPNAKECHMGNYSGNPAQRISILDGIKQRADDEIEVKYAQGCNIVIMGENFIQRDNIVINNDGEIPDDLHVVAMHPVDPVHEKVLIDEAVAVANECDAVVVVLGENESTCREGWSGNKGDRTSLDLLGLQDELAAKIIATGKPTVIILNHGRVNSVNAISESAEAILETWFLGQETGLAVADILFGNVNPSGKLSQSVPRSVGHLPCYYNKKNRGLQDIYVLDTNTPLYPFGYGLSYTSFAYSNAVISANTVKFDESFTVSVDVTNTGTIDGTEVVQLYIGDIVSSVCRPAKELKDYARIELKASEKKTVTFTVTPEKLAFYNIDMDFTVEKGSFNIMIGSSSDTKDLSFLNLEVV